MLLQHLGANKLKFSTLKRTVIGGSACPPAMIKAFQDDYGVGVFHAWGMTEMSPLGTVGSLKAKQGRSLYGIDMKIVDENGGELPRDGQTSGELRVRGPWVIAAYFKGEGGDPLVDGWFPTGDVATIDADGFMQITDRGKDMIKSGGEWISSIALEHIALSHPAVHEAAVVAVPHPKWGERPLLVAVRRPGTAPTRTDVLGHYEGRVARWQVPDDVVFLPELPHTATGKVLKLKLREMFRDHRLPEA